MEYKLSDLTKIYTGKLNANAATPNGKYPFFTCSKEISKINSYSYNCECILVAGNGDLNVKYFHGKFDAYQRTYIIENKRNDIMYMPYLYYFMSLYISKLRNQTIGGVIKYIKLNNLTDIIIELPEVDVQREIVEKIKKVQKIRVNKRNKLVKFDTLIKARFVEMFGEFPYNEKGWDIGTIRDLVSDVRYGTSKKASENNDGKYPYLRMNNITYDGKLDLRDLKSIDLSEKDLEKYSVKKDDILFNRTNSKELVGKTCVYNIPETMILAGFIIRVRLNELANPLFVSAFLNTDYSKQLFKTICKNASGQSNINATELQKIKIYIPPISLQNEFADFVRQVDKSKVAVQKSLDETQKLFSSLMQEYFG